MMKVFKIILFALAFALGAGGVLATQFSASVQGYLPLAANGYPAHPELGSPAHCYPLTECLTSGPYLCHVEFLAMDFLLYDESVPNCGTALYWSSPEPVVPLFGGN